MVYSVSWCVIYVCFQQRHLCLQLHCYPWRTMPLRSSCDLAAHVVPLKVRALWPFLQVHVHSSLQNSTQTFVCWVSVVLPVHGEFTPFLLHSVISGVPGGSRAKHVFESETWCDGDMGGNVLVTDQHRRVEKKYPKGPPGRNRSPRALMQDSVCWDRILQETSFPVVWPSVNYGVIYYEFSWKIEE